jgi:para-aminobenzoate synthetase/4-amino-4-deoxychorismate lyase
VTAIFGLKNNSDAWSLGLASPSHTLQATRLVDVVPLLETAEAEALAGSYVAVMLSYEAAPAFDRAFKTHTLHSLPLAWAAVFPNSAEFPPKCEANYSSTSWQTQITRSEYSASVERIREMISAGDTYQVNYSFPITAKFKGDAHAWYRDLCIAQGAQYCAYLDLGRYKLLSLSPELFFERRGNHVITKPMKGTVKRGRWPAEDEQLASWLRNSAKDRAENVMIVDLLRNDLGKVSVPGSVRASSLFQLERFETLWQMTSTVESTLKGGVSFADLMGALFPCGSVTGAPKVRTMEIINDLEPFPRGAYTGAIGFLRPGGDCIFNVAIRTLVLDSHSGEVTFGVGGGVTFDSTAEREYEECMVKSSFLLNRPITFQLLETILLEEGDYFLLDRHLARLEASANFLGFIFPEKLQSELDHFAVAHGTGSWKTRILLTKDGQFEFEALRLEKIERELRRVALAKEPIDSTNRLFFHKTTSRSFYSSQLEAQPDCDDVVFWNERGEVTESSIANVVLPAGGRLFTPPVSAGLLAGTFRDQLLAEGRILERTITIEELKEASEFFLINSVHKWMRATVKSPDFADSTDSIRGSSSRQDQKQEDPAS